MSVIIHFEIRSERQLLDGGQAGQATGTAEETTEEQPGRKPQKKKRLPVIKL